MGSLRASTLLLATLLIGLLESCRGLCTRSFFAQPVIYDRAMGIDFYFTGINVATVAACAEFCGARRFCRTAIYNSFTRTCAISYEYTLNCRYNKNRYTDFDVRRTTSHLIQVACVSKCDNERASHMSEGAGLPETLRKVELITGEPHDGMRGSISTTKQIHMVTQLKMAPDAAEQGFEKRVSIISSSRTVPAEDAFINSLRKSGSSQICYRTIDHRYLLGGSFEQHSDTTIEECRCLCAATYSSARLHHCRSFQWYQSGKCVLNKGSHMGKYDLIEDSRATYQFISCEIQVLLGVANKVCTEDGKPVEVSRTSELPTTTLMPTTKPSNEVRTTIWSFMTMPTTTPSTGFTSERGTTTETPTTSTEVEVETSTSVLVTEETTKPTESTTVSEETTKTTGSIKTETTTVATTDTVVSLEPSTAPEETKETAETLRTAETEQEVTSPATTPAQEETTREIGHDDEDASFEIVKRGCFEEIPGYMMVNVAGGLEHDVSIEECKCFCANSKTSRRYSFDCLSATYYHDERDCILNLDDRNRSPQLLEKQEKLTVTYVGPTCGKGMVVPKRLLFRRCPQFPHGSAHIEPASKERSQKTAADPT
ncbi:PAN domain protein [Ancylostoma caninum]|uniref:PAN domain protein n=1 Tax=Ancylostoma caninum TaxID=29170 RepID=A0A368HB09_ANCCA|nr:PAN domain protein [Ancylostoma caninum]